MFLLCLGLAFATALHKGVRLMVLGVRLMVLGFRLMVNGPTFSLYLGDVWH